MKGQFAKSCKRGLGAFGRHLGSELKKSRRTIGKALKDACKNLVSDAITSIFMELFQMLIMEVVIEPLLRKLRKLSKQCNCDMSEFVAA